MGAQEGRAFTKFAYDGDGRQTASYSGYYTGSMPESYADALVITTSNKIFEQTISTFDDGGNLIASAVYQRFHDATGSGVLNLPDGSQPKARVSYFSTWYDGIGRATASADYGTNGNAAWTRPDSVPNRSDDVLVTTFGYNSAGNQFQTIDPAGRAQRRAFNALGKAVLAVSHYIAVGGADQRPECESGMASSGEIPPADWRQCLTPGDAENVTVSYAYNADGNLIALTAYNPSTGDQVTRYEYGVTLAEGPIASNDLLRSTVYPDAIDSGDRIIGTFNRQGQATAMTDQNGTRHLYEYDGLGRLAADRVDQFGAGIDDGVVAITTTYNSHGLTASVTSLDGANVIVNQVTRTYNAFDQLISEAQSHEDAVGSGTPKVEYVFADASGTTNTTRPLTMTYPDGRVVTYSYGASGGDDDRLSRVAGIDDASSAQRVAYTYLGLGAFVQADYPESEVRWDLITGSGANLYAGLDRFGRVIDCLWRYYGTTPADRERVQYGYDRASNRIWRKNAVAPGDNDELYAYDGVQRLVDMGRGDLIGSQTALDDVSFGQSWKLDATGNWSGFRQLDTATPADNLDQQRTANKANEITAIARRYGPDWTTPVYDRAGNTTNFPQQADPTAGYQATYDAWNRLAWIEDGETVVGEYRYDGLNRRVAAADEEAVVRHAYYSQQWQLLEERLDDADDPERQFLWGLRYIDDLVLRDRDTDGSGSLDERLYALQDANWNITAVVDTNGAVQERYRYSAYGTPTFLEPNFSPKSPNRSELEWEILFAGYRWDAAAGLYHVRWRYMNSGLGIWLTRDPEGYIDGPNSYYLLRLNPISLADAFGLQAEEHECDECHKVISTAPKSFTVEWVPPGKKKKEPRTCPIDYTCDCDGCGGSATASQPDEFNVISICLPCGMEGLANLVLPHELDHAKRYCMGEKQDNCDECLVDERKAHRVNCGALYPQGGIRFSQCVKCGVYLSCMAKCAAEPAKDSGRNNFPYRFREDVVVPFRQFR